MKLENSCQKTPENAAEELMMPDDLGKGSPRKGAIDAGEMARTIRDADAGRKSVRDAAEANQPQRQ